MNTIILGSIPQMSNVPLHSIIARLLKFHRNYYKNKNLYLMLLLVAHMLASLRELFALEKMGDHKVRV